MDGNVESELKQEGGSQVRRMFQAKGNNRCEGPQKSQVQPRTVAWWKEHVLG